jgi:hypothetical protein
MTTSKQSMHLQNCTTKNTHLSDGGIGVVGDRRRRGGRVLDRRGRGRSRDLVRAAAGSGEAVAS